LKGKQILMISIPRTFARRWARWIAIALVGFSGLTTAFSQVSGFISSSYGYHGNPLYNFESIGGQLLQEYLELRYAHPVGAGALSGSYVGGLMLFNNFTDRNYLEHTARIEYRQSFGRIPPIEEIAGIDEGKEDIEESADPDSMKSYLEISARITARNDKLVYEEYDNTGWGIEGSYRFRMGPLYLRFSNDCGLHKYRYLEELSNVTDVISLQVGSYTADGVSLGVLAQVGIKHFASDQYDTTRFEVTRTYVEKSSGKGKAGAKLIVPSDKSILVNETTGNSSQIAGGVFAATSWTGGTLKGDFLYRHNTGSGSRYLAQFTNTTMLTEDVYNDFFNYEGPSLQFVLRQSLPAGLHVTATAAILRKRFEAPALNLDGDVVADNRIDLHGSVEIWLSRYFDIFDGLGLDVALSGGVVRNQSNDNYNDFSFTQLSLSVGLGF
jgi:hypothetical protein